MDESLPTATVVTSVKPEVVKKTYQAYLDKVTTLPFYPALQAFVEQLDTYAARMGPKTPVTTAEVNNNQIGLITSINAMLNLASDAQFVEQMNIFILFFLEEKNGCMSQTYVMRGLSSITGIRDNVRAQFQKMITIIRIGSDILKRREMSRYINLDQITSADFTPRGRARIQQYFD